MKKATLIIFILSIIMIFSACTGDEPNNGETQGENTSEDLVIDVLIPSGSPVMSMAKLVHDNPELGTDVTVNYEVVASTDALQSKIISGEADIAIVPTNLASILYNKGVNYQIAATTIWGNLYFVSDHEISSITELENAEIYLFGKGLTPDIIFSYLLKSIGINAEEDLNITYVNGATEIAPLFLTGEAKMAIIPEPMLTVVKSKKDNVVEILDLQEEWKRVTGSENSYPQASVIINKELTDSHKDIVESFLTAYEESINWVNENTEEAGAYAQELDESLDKDVVAKSIPYNNIYYFDASDVKEDIKNYYQILFNHSPATIGEKMPDEGIYYER